MTKAQLRRALLAKGSFLAAPILELNADPSLASLCSVAMPGESFCSYDDLSIHDERETTREEFCRSFSIEVRLMQLFQIGASNSTMSVAEVSRLFATRRTSAHGGATPKGREPGTQRQEQDTALDDPLDADFEAYQLESLSAGGVAREIWITMGTHGLWGGSCLTLTLIGLWGGLCCQLLCPHRFR